MKKVIRLTESELTDLIKRIIVETEMDMNDEMSEGDMMYDEMDEAWYSFLTRTMGDEDEFKDSLRTKLRNYSYLTGREVSQEEKQEIGRDLYRQAKEDGFSGELVFKGPKSDRELVYVTGADAKSSGPGVTSISR